MQHRERNTVVDAIRGVAILIVVYGHAVQVNLSEGETYFIWSKLILSFQMPLFFGSADIHQDFRIPV